MVGRASRRLRILISSPGDVGDERERARQVIESLRRRYARYASLEPIFWEDLPLQAEMSFQQGIDLVLSGEAGVDVAVFILWSRLGSPLGPVILKPDQSEYLSGTERELHLMLEARAQSQASGRARPNILCYRRADDSSFDERLRGRSTAEQQELISQKAKVEAFFEREFRDPQTGANTRAYHTYDRPISFSQRLRTHLIELLDPLAQRDEAAVIWDLETQGPPYLGLSAFNIAHADVFFGREEETLEARHALREQARNGCAFLLLSGPSASGKSSLAQAGVAPAVIENELDDQVKGWRALVVSPSELAPSLVTGLVWRICADGVMPELRADLYTQAFITALSENPAKAIGLALKPAFERLGARLGGAQRLIIVVDQLEELFVSSSISAEERSAFVNALEALARSGSIWIVATVRADFYEHVQAQPGLVRMKAGAGQLDILAPSADALRRMVEEPAIRAGLVFEKLADGKSVADLILRDAAAHSELLPLIEDLLRELYERREGRTLTLAAYEALGRSVEGAMALRAERVFASLGEAEQAAFGRVLEMMVTHGHAADDAGASEAGGGDARLVRQWADLSRYPANTPERRLIEAYVAARLFTAGSNPETDAPSAAVAHESLLRVWPRAVAWAEDNRAFLRTRALVARRLKDGSPLLEGDPLLSAARDHLARNPSGFSPALAAFITQSVEVAEAARRRAVAQRARRRLLAVVGAGLAMLTIVGVGLGSLIYFSDQRRLDASAGQLLAEAQSGMAQRDYAHAEIAAAAALKFRDSPAARDLLLSARSKGVRFVRSSYEAQPEAGWTWFSDDGALSASVLGASVLGAGADAAPVISITDQSTAKEAWRIALPKGARVVDTIEFGDERRAGARDVAVAWSAGESTFHVAIWTLVRGTPAGQGRELDDPRGRHIKRIPSVAFYSRRSWIVTSSEDQRLSLWDTSTVHPRLIWTQADTHGTAIHGVAFSRDGRFIASGGGDYLAKVWRVADMLAAGLAPEDGDVEAPAASTPLEEAAASVGAPEGAAEAPAAAAGVEPVWVMRGHSDSVFSVAFSPDGKYLATGGYDRIIRIWNLRLRNEQGQPPTISTLSGHEGTVLSLAYSDDGAFLFSGGKDETVRVWFVQEGRPILVLRPLAGVVRSVAARHFEDNISIGGETGWSLWSIRGGSTATLLWNGGATIGSIAFDPKGDLLAAAGSDGRVRVWDREFGPPRALENDGRALKEGLAESINGVAFSADGRWLAGVGEGYVVHVWDREQDWRPVIPQADVSLRHDGPIWGLCFDPENRWLATANTDNNKRIRLWRVGEWSLLRQTEELEDTPYALACAPNGRLVAGDSRGRVTVRETDRLRITAQTANVSHGEVNVWSVALTQSPLAILSGNSDGRVRRWIPNDPRWPGAAGEEASATSDEDARVNPTINSVSYSRSHAWIAAGGDGASVEIYDRSMRRVRSLRGHDGTVWWVTFDPDGARLAYGGIDRILRVYNLEEIERLLQIDTPEALYQQAIEATGLSLGAESGPITIQRRARR